MNDSLLLDGKNVRPLSSFPEFIDEDFPIVQETTLFPQLSNSSINSVALYPNAARRRYPELAAATSKLRDVSEHLAIATIEAKTGDHEDHTYCGIFFDIKARTLVPYHFVEIQSISIRGELGLLSVYATEDGTAMGKEALPGKWRRHFGPREVEPSVAELRSLELDIPIRLAPGTLKGIYIHSETLGDKAIVYDNERSPEYTYEDNIIRIYHGMAHVSNIPFAPTALYGGPAFRRGREFVGSMRYGVRQMMWTPEVHHHFPLAFRRAIFTFMCCHSTLSHQPLSLGKLPLDVFFLIINMLPVDWFPLQFSGDDSDHENDAGPDLFHYKGHVGSIAALRQKFDEAREENLAAAEYQQSQLGIEGSVPEDTAMQGEECEESDAAHSRTNT
jgi:hypothetical protein